MTSLGLKKDRTGTYQGSSASPECALSCPSAEGFTVLFYGDSHFRAGSHFLYAVFLFLLEMSPQTFDQGPVSRHFWTVNSVWHFVKLRCSLCLLFFANKYTWVHRNPSTRYSFLLCEENQEWNGHSSKPLHLQQQCPEVSSKGFRCLFGLVWFVPAGAESLSSFKNKTKTKNRVSKDFIIFFQIPIYLPDGLYNEED